jgi:dTDP-4-amino-4,6-dideoxygalactose transaminase
VLDGYQELLDRRRAYAARLRERLEPLGYRFQEGCQRSPWQFVPVLAPSPDVRERALAVARQRGIELRSYFDPPLDEMPAFDRIAAVSDLSNTAWLARRSLSLPMADLDSVDAVTAISGCLESAL